MKRRVYHLAQATGLSADEVILILRDAGFHVKRKSDQVAKDSVDWAMRILCQQRPNAAAGSSAYSSAAAVASTSELLPISTRIPTKRTTDVIPRRLGKKQKSAVHYLTSQQISDIHFTLVEIFAAANDPIFPSGPKDEGLLESAAFRPKTSLGNTEKYETIYSKAAAMFHSLILNHPFHNGNKRTALVSLVVFMDINGVQIDASDDELFEFVIRTAKRDELGVDLSGADGEVERIEEWLRLHGSRTDDQPKEMDLHDFLVAVEAAGGRYRKSGKGGKWVVWGPNDDSISIGCGIAKLQGSVVKRYMQKLGLSHGMSGMHFDEFHEGVDPEKALIRKFRTVLNRLAHT